MPETYDLIIRGGTVVNHDGIGRTDVGVRDGCIAARMHGYATLQEAGKHRPAAAKRNHWTLALTRSSGDWAALSCAAVHVILARAAEKTRHARRVLRFKRQMQARRL